MRTETRTVQIGERTGDIDWSYDFRQHFDNMCTNDERRNEACERSKAMLRDIEDAYKAGKRLEATTDGGWPRFGWNRVMDVGMYDGWPYWKPVPSVFTVGPLGGEWHSFRMITGFRIKEPEAA